MFQRITKDSPLEVRQAITADSLARAETAFSAIVLAEASKKSPDPQKIADLTRSYLIQQNKHIERNSWGLTPEEVKAGLGKEAQASLDAFATLAQVKADDVNVQTLADALVLMGVVTSEQVSAKLPQVTIEQVAEKG